MRKLACKVLHVCTRTYAYPFEPEKVHQLAFGVKGYRSDAPKRPGENNAMEYSRVLSRSWACVSAVCKHMSAGAHARGTWTLRIPSYCTVKQKVWLISKSIQADTKA